MWSVLFLSLTNFRLNWIPLQRQQVKRTEHWHEHETSEENCWISFSKKNQWKCFTDLMIGFLFVEHCRTNFNFSEFWAIYIETNNYSCKRSPEKVRCSNRQSWKTGSDHREMKIRRIFIIASCRHRIIPTGRSNCSSIQVNIPHNSLDTLTLTFQEFDRNNNRWMLNLTYAIEYIWCGIRFYCLIEYRLWRSKLSFSNCFIITIDL